MATILITDYQWADIDIERKVLHTHNIIVAESGDEDELIALAPQADAILTCWKHVTDKVLDAASKCKIVSRYGVGLDNIAVSRATELGILVAYVPDYCVEEVSDHAMALLLACARRIVIYDRLMQKGEWNLAAGRPMFRLRGKTLGLIGYGNIGRVMATKAHALGLNVIAYTPYLEEGIYDDRVTVTHDRVSVLNQADFVSLHTPLNDETKGMVDADFLAAMKPTAYLINTSRGGIINEDALLGALNDEDKGIAGAGLDVLIQEPAPPEHPLRQHHKVIITPHAAFDSVEALAELQLRSAEHVAQVLNGEPPAILVNPSVLKQDVCRL